MCDKYTTQLPYNCFSIVVECMQKIENITGEKYNLNIQQFGKNMTHVYSSINKNTGPFIVSNMKTDYQELNGTYSCLEDLAERISELESVYKDDYTTEMFNLSNVTLVTPLTTAPATALIAKNTIEPGELQVPKWKYVVSGVTRVTFDKLNISVV